MALPAHAEGAAATSASSGSSNKHVAVTVGPDFPHLLTGEVDVLTSYHWQIGINGGGFAYTFNTNGYSIPFSTWSANGRLRWHPFAGSFFLGLGVGVQNLNASTSQSFTATVSSVTASVPTTLSGGVTTPFATPMLGWLVVTHSGFTFDFEVGYQINFSTSSNITTSISDPNLQGYSSAIQALPAYQDAQSKVQNQINTLGNLNLPYAALRIGWAF